MNNLRIPESLLILFCVLFLAAGILSLNTMLVYNPDSARYLIWANSLAHLSGYEDTSGPEISRYVIHAPLYSLLLAPSQLFFPNNIIAAKVETLLFEICAIVFLFLFLREKTSGWYAFLGCLLFMTNRLTVVYSGQVLSEIPFLCCCTALLVAAEKADAQADLNFRLDGILIFLSVSCVLLREVGLAFVVGLSLYFFLKKQRVRGILVIVIPLLFYALWYIRNNVIVASNERLVNIQLFFGHLYTTSDASMPAEFCLRLLSNLKAYGWMIGQIIAGSGFPLTNELVRPNDPFIIAIAKILPWYTPVLSLITAAFVIMGLVLLSKSKRVILLFCSVAGVYCIPVLLYPVNDVRFLFPLVVFFLLFLLKGLQFSVEKLLRLRIPKRVVIGTGAILFVLWLVPGMVWMESYIYNCYNFSKDAEKYSNELVQKPWYPELFAKPMQQAALWLSCHGDSSTTVMCHWKELTFWLTRHKIIENDVENIQERFDLLIRDYQVQYIVSLISKWGGGEYDVLMARSQRYIFQKMYKAGNIEIYEVQERRSANYDMVLQVSPGDTLRNQFLSAVVSLENNPLNSYNTLCRLIANKGNYSDFFLYAGVAQEFLGNLDSAASIFSIFKSDQQSLIYVRQAWYHQDLLAQLKNAEHASSPIDRANGFFVAAIRYWQLGYRQQAMRAWGRSVREDSTFFPSLVFQSIFSLQNGDTAAAKKFYTRVAKDDTNNVLLLNLKTVWNAFDLLGRNSSKENFVQQHLRIAIAYREMGMNEQAIDEYRTILKENENNADAIQNTAQLYEMKKRIYPAYQYYKRLSILSPNKTAVAEKCKELAKMISG